MSIKVARNGPAEKAGLLRRFRISGIIPPSITDTITIAPKEQLIAILSMSDAEEIYARINDMAPKIIAKMPAIKNSRRKNLKKLSALSSPVISP